ncbi:DUF302 domain-containing protein [Pseudotabrizicola sediminis]|uniref:DUF302 domain-containing protein n=1 Tax=Pseudotabrizicola sediminis TaxID=2486418 RepID=A0ABY2KH68_9RHOB|nr:DUF302 domain-containing protein [Pseudotabrizicola sediminis]TGD41624.1 DUF302 domain-containing protein [Pseudotabrizicola sediminis]TGD60983.1 DUF302 domain-containing protein [Tabrizicola sp. WMC-M-20]
MNASIRHLIISATAAMALTGTARAEAPEYFIIHHLDQAPEDAAAMVRQYVETDDDWSFIFETRMMGGAVIGLKICYNDIRRDVVAAGMHTLAMMPCGNLAFYAEDGQSTLSMLDMSYMPALFPHPSLEVAADKARPAYAAMLSEVLGVD